MLLRIGIGLCALIAAFFLFFDQGQPESLNSDEAQVAEVMPASSGEAAQQEAVAGDPVAQRIIESVERGESKQWLGQLLVPARERLVDIHIWFWPNAIEQGVDWHTADEVFMTRSSESGRFVIPDECLADIPYSCAAVGQGLISTSVVAISRDEFVELPLEQLLGQKISLVTRTGDPPEIAPGFVFQNARGTRSGPRFPESFHPLDLPRDFLRAEKIPEMDSRFKSDYSWNIVVACPIQVGETTSESSQPYFGVVLPGYRSFARPLPLHRIRYGRLPHSEWRVQATASGWTDVGLRSKRALSNEARKLLSSASLSSVELLLDPLDASSDTFSIELASFERDAGAKPLRLPNGEYEIYCRGNFGTAELPVPGPGPNSSWKLDGKALVLELPTEEVSAVALQPLLPEAAVAESTYFRLRSLYTDDYASEIGQIEAPFVLDGFVSGDWLLEFAQTREGFANGIDFHYVNLIVPPGLGSLIQLPALK